jgi:hypothetical protein
MKWTFYFTNLIVFGIIISSCASSNISNNSQPFQLNIGETIDYSLFIEQKDPWGLTTYELKNYWYINIWRRNPRRVTVRLDDDKKIRSIDYQFGIDDQILRTIDILEAIRLFDEEATQKGMELTQDTINSNTGFDNSNRLEISPELNIRSRTYNHKNEGWGMILLIYGLPNGRDGLVLSLFKILPENGH